MPRKYIKKEKRRKKKNHLTATAMVIVVVGIAAFAAYHFYPSKSQQSDITITNTATTSIATSSPSVSIVTNLPTQKVLEDGYYIGQTFNNCAPSALSMDLSYYGISVSQAALAADLRPTNNESGKDDDKSTSPDEVAAEAEKYGLTAYYRPNGSISLLEEFVANGIPVLVRTQYLSSEDFLHYRVIKGYDQTTGEVIDEDGIQGPEVHYSYADFMQLWKMSNYEYVVLVPPGKEALVQSLLGNDFDEATAWKDAVATAQQQFEQSPSDVEAGFNLATALYHTGDYQSAVTAFTKVQPQLTEHVLWYQLEPIEAYLALGNYNQVFMLSSAILSDNNPAYPELYVLMGEAYQKEGNLATARTDFERALFYNRNLASAQQALATLPAS
jgi:tetratricopeptide (TPR) repeat protein